MTPNRISLRCLIAAVALVFVSLAWAVEPTAFVMVEMSNGTKLATDYYLPDKAGPAFPVLLARSTYTRNLGDTISDHTKRGYAVVVQDVRGFHDSEGEHRVFFADGWQEGLTDGADTVAWIKQQPWCNGKIGTFGGSALGITQVLLAPATRDVAAQCIDVAGASFYGDMAYQGGVWRKNMCERWLTLLKLESTMETWKGHPTYDDFWTYYDVRPKAQDITAPAIHMGAWFDIFQQGTIDNFVTRQKSGGKGAKGNQRLIITPHGHGKYAEGVTYTLPDDVGALHVSHHRRAFYDYWLKGEQDDIATMPPVYYYTLGDDTNPDAPGMEWRTAQTWPPFPTKATPYYLAEEGLLSTDTPTTQAATASFTYDPTDPFPTHGGPNLLLPLGPFDQREVNEGRTDLLGFASVPLTEPIEVTGHVTVRLFVSTDVPDTDFTAKLIDIFPPGDDREILMLDGIQRVKFRHGFDKPAALLTSSDEVIEIEIDLWSTSWVYNTDHRIGLQISSSNYPRFEKNPNTGDDFPDESNLRVAHNAVHMSKDYPSAVILPIRPPDREVTLAEQLNPKKRPPGAPKSGPRAKSKRKRLIERRGK